MFLTRPLRRVCRENPGLARSQVAGRRSQVAGRRSQVAGRRSQAILKRDCMEVSRKQRLKTKI